MNDKNTALENQNILPSVTASSKANHLFLDPYLQTDVDVLGPTQITMKDIRNRAIFSDPVLYLYTEKIY